MDAGLTRAHELFAASAGQILVDLRRAGAAEPRGGAEERDAAARSKALAYVWLAASQERLIKDALLAVFDAVNAAAVPRGELSLCLLSAADNATFKSLAVASRHSKWEMRASLLDGSRDAEIVRLTVDDLPYDGRTVRPRHYDLIQRVLGLPANCFADARDRTALEDLAEHRNQVAHGIVNPITLGRQKRAGQMVKNFERIVDAADAFVIHLDDYLSGSLFRRVETRQ